VIDSTSTQATYKEHGSSSHEAFLKHFGSTTSGFVIDIQNLAVVNEWQRSSKNNITAVHPSTASSTPTQLAQQQAHQPH
jgi:hypothetical protein